MEEDLKKPRHITWSETKEFMKNGTNHPVDMALVGDSRNQSLKALVTSQSIPSPLRMLWDKVFGHSSSRTKLK